MMTVKALQVLKEVDVIVGYKTYVKLIEEIITNQQVISTGMTKEVNRCRRALQEAATGKQVAMISSGDPGVYGMAGLVLELWQNWPQKEQIDIEIIPGVTAAGAAAACLGAPLMQDFVTISLSDLLTPWEEIQCRVELAAQGDFVVAIYNPKSKKRLEQIEWVRQTMLRYRDPATLVGIVRNACRSAQEITVSNLDQFTSNPIDMFSLVIIGNSKTKRIDRFLVTPRGYHL